MSDLSEFEALSRKTRVPCRVGLALDKLTPAEVKLFVDACDNRERVSTGGLAKWLKVRGHDVNNSAAIHHRARTCSCYGRA